MAVNSNGPNLGLLVNADDGDSYGEEGRRAMRGYDALIQPNCLTAGSNTAPDSPADGECHIVGTAPTGVWAGKANNIARWSTKVNAWEFYVPRDGWTFKATTGNVRWEYSAAAGGWVDSAALVLSGLGSLASKTAPVDGDSAVITDSAESNKPKRTTMDAIKAYVKSAFGIADVSGLQAALDSKPTLVGGKLNSSVLPALAVVDVYSVASQAAMLALGTSPPSGQNPAEPGDIAIRTDEDKTYILTANPASTLANWTYMPNPGQVVSVAGRQGVVVLQAADISDSTAIGRALMTAASAAAARTTLQLGNVDNTSDANKPISSVQQTALNAKADDNAVVHKTGNESIAGVKTYTDDAVFNNPRTTGTTAGVQFRITKDAGNGAAVSFARSSETGKQALFSFETGTPGSQTFDGFIGTLPDLLSRIAMFSGGGGSNDAMVILGGGQIAFGNAVDARTTPSIVFGLDGSASFDNDVQVVSATKGLILKSPNGTRYRVRVNDAGALFTETM